MGIDVTASLEIDAPPEAVAAVQFDPRRDPDWIGGVDRVELVTPLPLEEGSQVRRFGGFMGRPIVWLMRVEAFEPARHVGMHALESPFPMDVDYRLEPLDRGRTRAQHPGPRRGPRHVRRPPGPSPRSHGPALGPGRS